jgi:hypothetical protein
VSDLETKLAECAEAAQKANEYATQIANAGALVVSEDQLRWKLRTLPWPTLLAAVRLAEAHMAFKGHRSYGMACFSKEEADKMNANVRKFNELSAAVEAAEVAFRAAKQQEKS